MEVSVRTKSIRKKLLAWYAVEARDLPWRRTDDPYAILVSEIMLQQTRVETALRYYERFLERFPSVGALANASIDDVLKMWEGLGYYRRAHNLHRAAKSIVEIHDGRLPETVAELRALPGIGPYTAPAIASIAFGANTPVLDGNVIRVLARLSRIPGDPARAETRRLLSHQAQQLARDGDAAAVNQALMDLGARLCRPRSPRCHDCPIVAECDAHHVGEEIDYPQKPARAKTPHITVVAGVIWDDDPFARDGNLLIARRCEADMLGGLWEFPGGRVEDGETHETALVRELHEELGISVDVIGPLLAIDHAYTHFRMTLHAYHCRHTGGEPEPIECADWAWTTIDDLDTYALSAADRKIASALYDELKRRSCSR